MKFNRAWKRTENFPVYPSGWHGPDTKSKNSAHI